MRLARFGCAEYKLTIFEYSRQLAKSFLEGECVEHGGIWMGGSGREMRGGNGRGFGSGGVDVGVWMEWWMDEREKGRVWRVS